MTEQEVFNKVWDHIITQGKPSLSDKGMCRYRGTDGLQCAAGIFLTDEQAKELDDMGAPWTAAVVTFPELTRFPKDLMQCLQNCHDNASIWEEEEGDGFLGVFKHTARYVADEFNLTVPEGV
jgi:hypothetical protein